MRIVLTHYRVLRWRATRNFPQQNAKVILIIPADLSCHSFNQFSWLPWTLKDTPGLQVGDEAKEVKDDINIKGILCEDLLNEEGLNIFEESHIEIGTNLEEDWNYCRRSDFQQVATNRYGDFQLWIRILSRVLVL